MILNHNWANLKISNNERLKSAGQESFQKAKQTDRQAGFSTPITIVCTSCLNPFFQYQYPFILLFPLFQSQGQDEQNDQQI